MNERDGRMESKFLFGTSSAVLAHTLTGLLDTLAAMLEALAACTGTALGEPKFRRMGIQATMVVGGMVSRVVGRQVVVHMFMTR
ncbi:hypothetical protein EON65_10270 [archaeon]|nr:MAG: hypothetical protein EON65_10270 [archaeon]